MAHVVGESGMNLSFASNESFDVMLALRPHWMCDNVHYAPLPLPALTFKGILLLFLIIVAAGGDLRKPSEKHGHITKAELILVVYQVLTSMWAFAAIEQHVSHMDSSWHSHEAGVFLMALSSGTVTLVTTILQMVLKQMEEQAPAFRNDTFRVIGDTERLAEIFRASDCASDWPQKHNRVWTESECNNAAELWAGKEVAILGANAGGHDLWMMLTPFAWQIALGVTPAQAHFVSVRVLESRRKSSSFDNAMSDFKASLLSEDQINPSNTPDVEIYLPCDALEEYLGPMPRSPDGPLKQQMKEYWQKSGMPDVVLTFLPGGSRLWAIVMCCLALVPRLGKIWFHITSGLISYWHIVLYLFLCSAFKYFKVHTVMTKRFRWQIVKPLRWIHFCTFMYAAFSCIISVTHPNFAKGMNSSFPGIFLLTQWSLWTFLGMQLFSRLMSLFTGASGDCFFSSGELRASLAIMVTMAVQCFPVFILVSEDAMDLNHAPELVLSNRSLAGAAECMIQHVATAVGAAEALSIA